MPAPERIKPVIEKKLADMGLELCELKFIRAGSHSILRLFIDKEGGISIQDCEKASNEIAVVLDVENFSEQPYTLEVSSPGIDRPLTTEKDFKRAAGRNVQLRVKEDDEKISTLHGSVKSCDNGILTLATETGIKTMPLIKILSGKIEISFK